MLVLSLLRNKDTLTSANIGDCMFLVLRKNLKKSDSKFVIAYQSVQGQYMHNYPHQLDMNISTKEVGKITTSKELKIRAGDLIVAGSDGFFDNHFIKDTMSYINEHFIDQKKSLKEITEELG